MRKNATMIVVSRMLVEQKKWQQVEGGGKDQNVYYIEQFKNAL